jgi:hypothetical protein
MARTTCTRKQNRTLKSLTGMRKPPTNEFQDMAFRLGKYYTELIDYSEFNARTLSGALRIPVVRLGACRSRNTARWPIVTLATTLSPLRGAVAWGLGGHRRLRGHRRLGGDWGLGCDRRLSGGWGLSGGLAAWVASGKAEPVKNVGFLHAKVVSNAVCSDGLEVGPVDRTSHTAGRRVLLG